MYRVATDVGGTFTDLVYFEIEKSTGKALKIKTAKSDTTPSSYEKGVFDTINKVNVDIFEVDQIVDRLIKSRLLKKI